MLETVKWFPYAPKKATEGSAGYDLVLKEDLELIAGQRVLVKLGLYVAVPKGFMLNIVSRSGLALKGLTIGNAFGVVDADYRGELGVILNYDPNDFESIRLKKGDRIAQALLLPVPEFNHEVVGSLEELGSTERGTGGFGSTGKQ